jgi:hypothetical protein
VRRPSRKRLISSAPNYTQSTERWSIATDRFLGAIVATPALTGLATTRPKNLRGEALR